MEFWGVEVKAGETLKVQPGDGRILHLSQAALGESKKDKGTESIPVFVKFGNQKLVLGSLSLVKTPQLPFDLVFEKEFELSHNWKNGSVYFLGYRTSVDDGDDDFSDYSDDSLDEEMPLAAEPNGKSELQAPKVKEAASKAKVKVVEPVKDDEDDSDDDLDSDASDDLDSDEDMDGLEDDSEDEDDSEEDEETPTPKKAVGNKKRQAESATKTPVPAKKAKASPQKTDGKKGGHTATPHPAKNASKKPNSDKAKTPKSGGDVTCKSCSKSFKSEQAMESHSKVKHSAGK